MLYNNLSVNDAGHLTFAGADVAELAEEYGTPLYVMDESQIRKNARIYVDAMKKYFPEGSGPLYAGKALCFKGIYPIVQEEGMRADVVSAGEIYTALAAGFPSDRLFFHGTNKTDEEIFYALTQNVGYFITDNLNELKELDRQAGSLGKKQKVLLRVTVGIDSHTMEAINTGKVDSQFGVPIETGQAEEFLKEALACKNLDIRGLHSHIGSQIFESEPFLRQADILLSFAVSMREKLGWTAEILNLGGGFGVPYTEKDPEMNIPKMIQEISEHIHENCAANDFPVPVILMEPGRSIVANAGITLYTCGGTKKITGYRNYATVDGGMTDNPRYALYKCDYTVLNASRMNAPKDFVCTVAGRCCESGDRIQEEISIAEPSRGDILAVLTTGAYNYSMSMNYNRMPRPALVFVKDGESTLKVRRQTFEDLLECEL
ncbi:MAG: diaminopimelate decarboxylase [Eubacteriales bacterium]|nr:diaminopimelate decarboxylase [Eubacteriales bacterium]